MLIALAMVAKAMYSQSRHQANQNTTPAALEASSNEYSQNPTGQPAILSASNNPASSQSDKQSTSENDVTLL